MPWMALILNPSPTGRRTWIRVDQFLPIRRSGHGVTLIQSDGFKIRKQEKQIGLSGAIAKPTRAKELRDRGLTIPEIANALSTSERTVFRYLAVGD